MATMLRRLPCPQVVPVCPIFSIPHSKMTSSQIIPWSEDDFYRIMAESDAGRPIDFPDEHTQQAFEDMMVDEGDDAPPSRPKGKERARKAPSKLP